MRWSKLVVVAGLVASSLGCIQVEVSLALRPEGGGSFLTHVGLGPTMSRMVGDLKGLSPELDQAMQEGFGAKLSGADRKALAAGGITDVVLKTKASKKATSFDVGGTFANIASLSALQGVEATAKAAPRFEILQHLDGTHELVWNLKGDGEAKAGGDDAKPDVDPEKLQKLLKGMGDIGDMMAELTEFRMRIALDVPGDVLGVDPAWGKVDGSAVSWSLGADELMKATGGEKPPPFPDVVRVRFRAKGPIEGAIPAPPARPAAGSEQL